MEVSKPCTMSTLAIWILLAVLSGGEALQCYKCMNMNTSAEVGSPDVYLEITRQVKDVLSKYYYIDNENDMAKCPHPDVQEEPGRSAWADLETVRPCQARTPQEASCALGRFKVTAEDFEGKQYTLHGTILGCARHELLQQAIVEVRYKARDNTIVNGGNGGLRPQEQEKTSLIRHCGLGRYRTENREKGLTQEMEIEHCAKATNLCSRDFCIPPEESEVRVFLDQQEQVYIPWFWIILAAVILGVCVAALSMLGLKFS